MLIYPFRDESDNDIFAFSIDVTGANIPAVTPHTEWVFLEGLDTLKFPDPWDITDFQGVLDHLKADGICASTVSSLNSHQGVKAVHLHWSARALDMTARWLFCENPTFNSSRFQTLTSFRPKLPAATFVIGM
jgi:hypothetical protein